MLIRLHEDDQYLPLLPLQYDDSRLAKKISTMDVRDFVLSLSYNILYLHFILTFQLISLKL